LNLVTLPPLGNQASYSMHPAIPDACTLARQSMQQCHIGDFAAEAIWRPGILKTPADKQTPPGGIILPEAR